MLPHYVRRNDMTIDTMLAKMDDRGILLYGYFSENSSAAV